ncbi:MAG: hypothetical protein JO002_14570 [Burkholderiaceae bacterium]|nr:hypothetical protein [Burkholderiaceae bacterium]
MRRVPILAGLLLAILVSGCAPRARPSQVRPAMDYSYGPAKPAAIESNMAPDYTGTPARMFVVTDIGIDFGEDYGNSFQENFVALAKDCAIDSEVSRIPTFDQARAARQQRMRKFAPDTILTIYRNGGVTQQTAILSVIYDVKVIDVKSGKLVWRAQVNYEKGDFRKLKERGREIALELLTKMKDDQLLRNCRLSG